MGFRCLKCGMDFGDDMDALNNHKCGVEKEEDPIFKPKNIPKKSVKTKQKEFSLKFIEDAVNEGRLEIWADNTTQNIYFEMNGETVVIPCSRKETESKGFEKKAGYFDTPSSEWK